MSDSLSSSAPSPTLAASHEIRTDDEAILALDAIDIAHIATEITIDTDNDTTTDSDFHMHTNVSIEAPLRSIEERPMNNTENTRLIRQLKSPSSEPNFRMQGSSKQLPPMLRSSSMPDDIHKNSRKNIFASFYSETNTPSFVSKAINTLRTAAARLSVHQTFFCQICLENIDILQGYALTQCNHLFCHECIKSYLVSQVSDGITVIKCPSLEYVDHGTGVGGSASPDEEIAAARGKDCPCEIAYEDVRALLDEEMIVKYDRFKLHASDKNYRQCPKCSVSVLGNPKKPAMNCPDCKYAFCIFHADAHPNMSCKQYERRNREEEKASRALISQTSKRCPGCKMPVEKSGGCNHMQCSRCRTYFCWICGRKVSDDTYPTHYKWYNVFGCPGTQMNDWAGGLWTMILWRLFMLSAILIGPPLALSIILLLLSLYIAASPILIPICFCVVSHKPLICLFFVSFTQKKIG
eukprot:TRINITY_DN9942_c0_g1_i2.p1 TRINITY_DN9942_c0_g1~~TRINITY_DN9942_c0_g1_i2.p1  ORF type:complete len:465 (-),score=64.88 TRINITY_DN9942_c0_g1_i2:107-1501(-)